MDLQHRLDGCALYRGGINARSLVFRGGLGLLLDDSAMRLTDSERDACEGALVAIRLFAELGMLLMNNKGIARSSKCMNSFR